MGVQAGEREPKSVHKVKEFKSVVEECIPPNVDRFWIGTYCELLIGDLRGERFGCAKERVNSIDGYIIIGINCFLCRDVTRLREEWDKKKSEIMKEIQKEIL